MMPNVISGQAIGTSLQVPDETALSALNVQGVAIGSTCYVTADHTTFQLSYSTLIPSPGHVVQVAGINGLQWVLIQSSSTGGWATPSVMYAAPGGDVNNDGLSWLTAKATVMQCVDYAVTNVNIYIADQTPIGTGLAQGIWFMGPDDPGRHDFINTPSGTNTTKNSPVINRPAGGFTGIVAPGDWLTIFGLISPRQVLTVDSDTQITLTADADKTLSNAYVVKTPFGWRIAGLSIAFIGAGGAGGDLSSNPLSQIIGAPDRDQSKPAIWLSGNEQAGITFDSIQVKNAAVPFRSGIDSQGSRNSQVSQVYCRNCEFIATPASGPSDTVGPTVDLGVVLWHYFDNCFFGGVGNNISKTADNRAAVLIKPTVSGVSGLIYFSYCRASGGGGIKQYTNGGTYSCDVHSWITENVTDGTGCMPAYWCTDPTPLAGAVILNTVGVADDFGVPANIYIQAGAAPANFIVINPGSPPEGACTLIGAPAGLSYSTVSSSPLAQGQNGFWQGYVLARQNSAKRKFGSSAARFQNLASYNIASMSPGPGTGLSLATAASPDGLSNAARITTSSGTPQIQNLFSPVTTTASVGDWYFFGAWVRRNTITGTPNQVLRFIPPAGTIFTDGLFGNVDMYMPSKGDGEWQFLIANGKVATGSSANDTVICAIVDSGNSLDVAYPFMLHVATGTISDNEAAELLTNATYWPDYLAPSQSGTHPNQKFIAYSGLGTNANYVVGVGTGQITLGGANGKAVEMFDKSGTSLGVSVLESFTVNP
jgi:hypothetical protein